MRKEHGEIASGDVELEDSSHSSGPVGEGGAVQVSRGVHDDRGRMNVMRSITWGIVGRCKTEASQKPIPVHPILGGTHSMARSLPIS